MLDGKEAPIHVPDQPADNASISASAIRRLHSTAMLEVLAALQEEFRSILSQDASCIPPTPGTDATSSA